MTVLAPGHYFIYLWQLSWISCGLCVSNPWIYRFCHCFPLKFNIIPLHIPYKDCISSRYFKRTLGSVLTRYHNLHKQNTCLFRTEKLVPRNFISKRSQKCCIFGRHTLAWEIVKQDKSLNCNGSNILLCPAHNVQQYITMSST